MPQDKIQFSNYQVISSLNDDDFPIAKWEWKSSTGNFVFSFNSLENLLFKEEQIKEISKDDFINLFKSNEHIKASFIFNENTYLDDSSILLKLKISSEDDEDSIIECFSNYEKKDNEFLLKGFFRDITKFVTTANELDELKDTLDEREKLLEIGYWEVDPFSKELIWSNELYRLYGLNQKLVKPSRDFFMNRVIHPEDTEGLNERLDKLYTNQESFSTYYRIIRTDGSLRKIFAKGKVLKDSQGRFLKITGVSMDVTEAC